MIQVHSDILTSVITISLMKMHMDKEKKRDIADCEQAKLAQSKGR
jgi:hypothetical protein